MVLLNERQTKAVERLFKKVEVGVFGVGAGDEDGQVKLYLITKGGQKGTIVLDSSGLPIRMKERELEL